MKAVILAGGFGTRLSELTGNTPKPMIELGGKPVLWHIMNIFAHHGVSEFIIALGYKAEVIKEYFLNFYAFDNDLTINLGNGETTIHHRNRTNWQVHLVETGTQTQTGGRLKRLKNWIGEETFMMTYGDGLSDVSISQLLAFHRSHGRSATVTAVRPPARFGGLVLQDRFVTEFSEKNQSKEGWINGGFFVLEPEVLDYVSGDEIAWEREPLEQLASENQLASFCHEGFWQPMDTLREYKMLQALWESGEAPWKVWDAKVNNLALTEIS